MISTVFVMALAAMQPVASDTTRAARQAFTACLRAYVEQSTTARMPAADFAAAYPQQCTQQEAAFRAAVIQRETSTRATRANAEQAARDEVDEARTNFRERYEMAMAPE